MKAAAELVSMGTITVQLGERIEVGSGPKGTRLVVDVESIEVESDRVRASLAATDAADWLTLSEDGSIGCVDVRFTLKTDDGAYIYVEYAGRADMANGLIATAPTFQTGDERYAWLNKIQAVGAGALEGNGRLIYSLYEVVLTAA
jgi:hypothetical protein|tara:strand:- start:836 stop:1270 length:435 start_codon:yes stop_codon:yes gene_type:complete